MSKSGSRSLKRTYSLLNLRDWSVPLGVLTALLVLIFATGGTSRYDTPHIMLLRPAAILAAGFALISFASEHWRAYRPLLLLALASLVLTALHLVPLPPGIWQSLPGREIIAEIDQVAGLEGQWRPLSMFPEGTWNALYAMSVPMAALLLAVQLNEKDRVRLLALVILLCLASGMVGVLQAAGTDVRFYRVSSETAGLFANRNHQAAMLGAMFPMIAALALCASAYTNHTRPVRLVAATGLVALVPLIMVTGSRMGLVVGLIGFSCLIFMRFSRDAGSKGFALSGAMQAGAGALIAAGMAAGSVFLARDKALDRMAAGTENEMRMPVWESMLEFIPQYMPWGSGIGSFVPIYQIHEPPTLLIPGYFNQAHNDWIDIPLTSGLPGAVLALAALIMFALGAKSALAARGVAGHLRKCGIIVILVLAFASLSDYPLRTPILSALFAIAAVWAWSPEADNTHKRKPEAS